MQHATTYVSGEFHHVTDFRFPGCVDNVKHYPVFTSIIPFLKQTCAVIQSDLNLRSGVPIFFRGGKERLIQLLDYSSAAP